jgi:hypothetical protein
MADVAMDCVVYNTVTWRPIALQSLPLDNIIFGTTARRMESQWQSIGVPSRPVHVRDSQWRRGEMVPTTTTLNTASTCPECSLYTWSPNGRYIATAFENQICIVHGIMFGTSGGTDTETKPFGSLETTLTCGRPSNDSSTGLWPGVPMGNA